MGFCFFYSEIFSGIFLLCTGSAEQVCVGLGQLNSASFGFLHTGSTSSVSDSESKDKGKKDSVFLLNSTDPYSEVFKRYDFPFKFVFET